MKKNMIMILAAAILSLGVFQQAEAASTSAKSYRVKFSVSNVTDSAYTEVVAAALKDVVQISVFNTSPNPIVVAVGAAGSEVDQVIVPQGTLSSTDYLSAPASAYAAVPMVFNMRVTQGSRLAIKSLNSTTARGEFQLNAIYK